MSGDGWDPAAGERCPDNPCGVEKAGSDGLHWGPVGPDLLADPGASLVFRWCFHVAGHVWSLWRREAKFGPVGRRSLRTPRGIGREAAVEVEAGAVLVEALSVEYARDLHRLADFGIRTCDVDWEAICESVRAVPSGGRGPACRRHVDAARLHLRDTYWVGVIGEQALVDWDAIVALADALGHGRVLEVDEVWEVLAAW